MLPVAARPILELPHPTTNIPRPQVVLDAGYEEDVMVSNIKIGLGLGA